jgi:adenylate kinase
MILMLGTPGAGKTTQSQLLSEHLGCQWFSMGQLIRDYSSGEARQQMLAGKIIDDKVTLEIAHKALSAVDTAHEECVFEGNPRSIPQAQWWLDQVTAGRFKITGVLHLIASKQVAHDRIVSRGRQDDISEEVINQRFAEYDRSIMPTISYLKQNGVKVHDIDANGTIEQVAKAIHTALGV